MEEKDYSYLYPDDNGYIFMDQENYEQVTVPGDTIGDGVAYLQEGMIVKLGLFNGVAVTVNLPQRVILEITETEPVTKGQTASSSYKPPSSPTACARPSRRMSLPHARRHQHGRRLLRGTREGLICSSRTMTNWRDISLITHRPRRSL